MKHFILSSILMLMSVMVSMPASATTGNKEKNLVPKNIIVKQTTHFKDGRTLTLYFKKQGEQCEVYSPCRLGDFAVDDVQKVKSTNFEVVSQVEGKLYRKSTTEELLKVVSQMMKMYQ